MASLLDENKEILNRFEEKGVDLSKSYAFDFRVSLADRDSCKQVGQLFHDKYGVPKGGIFGIISDPEYYELSLALTIVPSAEAITEIEAKLLEVAKGFEDAEVFWEFRAR